MSCNHSAAMLSSGCAGCEAELRAEVERLTKERLEDQDAAMRGLDDACKQRDAMYSALGLIEEGGFVGVSEGGCTWCHNTAQIAYENHKPEPYSLQMVLARVHVSGCPVGAALGRRTSPSEGDPIRGTMRDPTAKTIVNTALAEEIRARRASGVDRADELPGEQRPASPSEPSGINTTPARGPEEAGTFFQRHIRCSMVSGNRVYKHDADCGWKYETWDPEVGRRGVKGSCFECGGPPGEHMGECMRRSAQPAEPRTSEARSVWIADHTGTTVGVFSSETKAKACVEYLEAHYPRGPGWSVGERRVDADYAGHRPTEAPAFDHRSVGAGGGDECDDECSCESPTLGVVRCMNCYLRVRKVRRATESKSDPGARRAGR